MTPNEFSTYVLPVIGVLLLAFCLYTASNPTLTSINTARQMIKLFGVELQISLLALFVLIAALCLLIGVYVNFVDMNGRIAQLTVDIDKARSEKTDDPVVVITVSGGESLPEDVRCGAFLKSLPRDEPKDLGVKRARKGIYRGFLTNVRANDLATITCTDQAHTKTWSSAPVAINEIFATVTREP